MRVLVVDDYALVRQGIANLLAGDDRIVVIGEAADGIDALRAIEKNQPDIVIMDVNMPRMNGIEATLEIRRRWPHIAVVGLSVQDDEATERCFLSAGADAFLSKHGGADATLAVIAELAERRARSR